MKQSICLEGTAMKKTFLLAQFLVLALTSVSLTYGQAAGISKKFRIEGENVGILFEYLRTNPSGSQNKGLKFVHLPYTTADTGTGIYWETLIFPDNGNGTFDINGYFTVGDVRKTIDTLWMGKDGNTDVAGMDTGYLVLNNEMCKNNSDIYTSAQNIIACPRIRPMENSVLGNIGRFYMGYIYFKDKQESPRPAIFLLQSLGEDPFGDRRMIGYFDFGKDNWNGSNLVLTEARNKKVGGKEVTEIIPVLQNNIMAGSVFMMRGLPKISPLNEPAFTLNQDESDYRTKTVLAKIFSFSGEEKGNFIIKEIDANKGDYRSRYVIFSDYYKPEDPYVFEPTHERSTFVFIGKGIKVRVDGSKFESLKVPPLSRSEIEFAIVEAVIGNLSK
ncbi:MAG: hypothetical protein NTW04_00615 [Elusimicrobia bacterium]|nr:hypothetical protein [Elusimicrobiota bacterium]